MFGTHASSEVLLFLKTLNFFLPLLSLHQRPETGIAKRGFNKFHYGILVPPLLDNIDWNKCRIMVYFL